MKRVTPVSPTTKKTYESHLKSMFRYSLSSPFTPAYVQPNELAEVVSDLLERTNLSVNTLAAYRSALLWFIPEWFHGSLDDESRFIAQQQFDRVKNLKPRKQGTKGKRTKAIPEEDLDAILRELTVRNQCHHKKAFQTLVWLTASVATGFRGPEWLAAQWVDSERLEISVPTAKQKFQDPAFTKNRKIRPRAACFRKVPVSHEVDRAAISQQLEYLEEYVWGWEIDFEIDVDPNTGHDRSTIWYLQHGRRVKSESVDLDNMQEFCWSSKLQSLGQEAYNTYYHAVRATLRAVCQYLWKGQKFYSLYCCRSQFSANQRAAVGHELASVFMGHSRPDSPSAGHYANRHQAHARFAEAGRQRIALQNAAGRSAQPPFTVSKPAAKRRSQRQR